MKTAKPNSNPRTGTKGTKATLTRYQKKLSSLNQYHNTFILYFEKILRFKHLAFKLEVTDFLKYIMLKFPDQKSVMDIAIDILNKDPTIPYDWYDGLVMDMVLIERKLITKQMIEEMSKVNKFIEKIEFGNLWDRVEAKSPDEKEAIKSFLYKKINWINLLSFQIFNINKLAISFKADIKEIRSKLKINKTMKHAAFEKLFLSTILNPSNENIDMFYWYLNLFLYDQSIFTIAEIIIPPSLIEGVKEIRGDTISRVNLELLFYSSNYVDNIVRDDDCRLLKDIDFENLYGIQICKDEIKWAEYALMCDPEINKYTTKMANLNTDTTTGELIL